MEKVWNMENFYSIPYHALTVTTAKSSSSLTVEMRPTSNSGWFTLLIAMATKLSNCNCSHINLAKMQTKITFDFEFINQLSTNNLLLKSVSTSNINVFSQSII